MVGVPDARLGEIVGALVVPRTGLVITTSEVKALCREQCAYPAPERKYIDQKFCVQVGIFCGTRDCRNSAAAYG